MPLVDVLERLGRPAAVTALDGEDAVYVVGGAVRDVLLGRRPHELDFVVEGDAVAVARRDFTVNAIALHIADGELTYYPGAREDLDERLLRVLHDGSFRDDPTRLLRLARYAARLDFAIEPRTDE